MGRRVVGVSGPLVLIALALGIANCSALDDEETSSSPEVHSPIPVLTPPPGWVLGSDHNNAPIVLEVFLDLVCPDSARAWHMLHQLREDHSDEDLKIIVHAYELPYHRNAYTMSQVGSLSHYSSMEIKSDDKVSVSYWEAALMLWSWWRHQMETFPALLVLCAANSPVTGEFSSQRPVTQSFDVFFDLRLNRWLNEQSSRRWFETPSCSLLRHCKYAIIMWLCPLEIRNGVSVSDVIVIEKNKRFYATPHLVGSHCGIPRLYRYTGSWRFSIWLCIDHHTKYVYWSWIQLLWRLPSKGFCAGLVGS